MSRRSSHLLDHRYFVLGLAVATAFSSALLQMEATPVSGAAAIVPSLRVVGQLEASGNMVVAVNLTKQNTLELTGIDPAQNRIMWQMPYSVSDLTPGVWPEPQIADGVVVDLDPTEGASNADVVVRGVNVSTGSVLWKFPAPEVVSDLVLSCLDNSAFCVPISDSRTSNDLYVFAAKTGKLIGLVPNIERAMDADDLYETSATTPTFEELGSGAKVAWKRSVPSIFGPKFTPSAGWDFELKSGLQVGTVAKEATGVNESTGTVEKGGASENLGDFLSVGLSPSTGKTVWKDSGSYDCGGTFVFLTAPVLCQFTGSLHWASTTAKPTFEKVTLKLAGLNTETGAIGWHQSATNVSNLLYGAAIPFLDGTHIVVKASNGFEDIDTVNGSTEIPSASATFWCENQSTYKLTITSYKYSSAPTYGACSASGKVLTGYPSTQPSTVGVKADGMFVWVSSKGLQATSSS